MLGTEIERRWKVADSAGALRPLETRVELIEGAFGPGSSPFILRYLTSSTEPGAPKKPEPPKSTWSDPKVLSPFVAPEPALVVASHFGPRRCHNVLLNKFPVVSHHLLLCTAEFRSQEEDLDEGDVLALDELAAGAYAGDQPLCFYNCGKNSGASQGHKHLQVVPSFVETTGGAQQPYPLVTIAKSAPDGATRLPAFPFRHAFHRLAPGEPRFAAYRRLLAECGIDSEVPRVSYSFLASGDWMIVIPRCCEGPRMPDGSLITSVNALGFAGSIFVKTEPLVAYVKRVGPVNILRQCACFH